MSERSIAALQKLRVEFPESRLGLVAFNMDTPELHFPLPPDDQLGFSFVQTRDNPGLALDPRMTLGKHYGGDLVLISSGGGIKQTITAMDLDAATFEKQVRALAAGAVR